MLQLVNETTIYSSIQNIPYTGIQGNITSAGSILTLGPGKYELIGEFTLESFGAASQVRIQLDSDIMLRWFGGSAGDDVPGVKKSFTTVLEESANTILNMTQNSGTNAEMDYNVLYRSTPRLALASASELEARKEAQMKWWTEVINVTGAMLQNGVLPGHYVYGGTKDYHLEWMKMQHEDLFFKYQKLLKKSKRKAEKTKLASSLKNRLKSGAGQLGPS